MFNRIPAIGRFSYSCSLSSRILMLFYSGPDAAGRRQPMEQIASLDGAARPSEVVVSAETLQLLNLNEVRQASAVLALGDGSCGSGAAGGGGARLVPRPGTLPLPPFGPLLVPVSVKAGGDRASTASHDARGTDVGLRTIFQSIYGRKGDLFGVPAFREAGATAPAARSCGEPRQQLLNEHAAAAGRRRASALGIAAVPRSNDAGSSSSGLRSLLQAIYGRKGDLFVASFAAGAAAGAERPATPAAIRASAAGAAPAAAAVARQSQSSELVASSGGGMQSFVHSMYSRDEMHSHPLASGSAGAPWPAVAAARRRASTADLPALSQAKPPGASRAIGKPADKASVRGASVATVPAGPAAAQGSASNPRGSAACGDGGTAARVRGAAAQCTAIDAPGNGAACSAGGAAAPAAGKAAAQGASDSPLSGSGGAACGDGVFIRGSSASSLGSLCSLDELLPLQQQRGCLAGAGAAKSPGSGTGSAGGGRSTGSVPCLDPAARGDSATETGGFSAPPARGMPCSGAFAPAAFSDGAFGGGAFDGAGGAGVGGWQLRRAVVALPPAVQRRLCALLPMHVGAAIRREVAAGNKPHVRGALYPPHVPSACVNCVTRVCSRVLYVSLHSNFT